MALGPEVLLGDVIGDIPVAARPLDFEIWVVTAGPDLMRFAVALTGNAHDAADAVQDALVTVYPRWRRVVARGGPTRTSGGSSSTGGSPGGAGSVAGRP